MILLVTLEKAGQPKEHQYEDRFLSAGTFQWQSQNRTTQGGKVGQAIRDHVKEGIQVHLFARRSAKDGQETAPFFYCGPLTFQSWEGEKPITVHWSLQQEIPKKTLEHLAGSDLVSG